MGILGRLKDLIRKTEEPEQLLSRFIESATEQYRAFTVEVNKFEASRLLILDRIKTANVLMSDWHSKAKLALFQNREDAARECLGKEQDEQKQLERLKEQLLAIEQITRQMKEQQTLLFEKLKEAKENYAHLVRRGHGADALKNASDVLRFGTEFESILGKVRDKEAEALALIDMRSSLDDEFAKLERDDALTKLKTELTSD